MEQDLIEVFKNEKFGNVRVVLIGEEKEAYFVDKDVTEILGYTIVIEFRAERRLA